MKPGVLLVWLTLLGSDGGTPAAFGSGISSGIPPAVWVGEWLVRDERRKISASIMPVPGREQLAGKLTFGDGPTAVVEHWTGRPEGRWLRLTRTGVGDGRLGLTESGRLVGRLTRLDEAGSLDLTRTAK